MYIGIPVGLVVSSLPCTSVDPGSNPATFMNPASDWSLVYGLDFKSLPDCICNLFQSNPCYKANEFVQSISAEQVPIQNDFGLSGL